MIRSQDVGDIMETVAFLDAVKARHKLATDYKLAKFLRWPPQRISMYRARKRALDDEACVQIAAALDVPPAYVMACIAAARAKDAAIKKHWLAAARLLKTGTAAVVLATVLAVSQNAPASPSRLEARLSGQAIHYAPRRRRRRPAPAHRRRRRISRTVTAFTPIVA